MSISMNVKISGLKELQAELAGFSDRRLRAAAATGLTRTANRMAVEWQKEIDTKIDQPTAFTKKAVRVEKARADSLTAKVALKDVSRGGMSQAGYLQQHEFGGGRLVKKFERALIASGAMPQGYITVPGKGVDRNGYGNVSRGTITAVISQLGQDFSPGYQRTISKDAARRAKSQARHGKRYIVMPVGNPSGVNPGVYVRGADRALRMVFAFKQVVKYSRKLTLQSSAVDKVQAIAAEEFDRAIDEQLARLRARG